MVTRVDAGSPAETAKPALKGNALALPLDGTMSLEEMDRYIVKTALERGVRTLVDLTPVNLGRDIDVIRRVAERSGAQIIAATGFYWHEEPWMEAWPVEKLADYLIRDIEQGIEGTAARAGSRERATTR